MYRESSESFVYREGGRPLGERNRHTVVRGHKRGWRTDEPGTDGTVRGKRVFQVTVEKKKRVELSRQQNSKTKDYYNIQKSGEIIG